MNSASSPATLAVALLLAALGLKITDLIKYIVLILRADAQDDRKEGWNGLVTLVLTAVIGVLVVQFLLKPSSWGDELKIGNELLKDLDFLSTVIFGIVFTALASTLYDFKKAIDGADDARKPKLIQ